MTNTQPNQGGVDFVNHKIRTIIDIDKQLHCVKLIVHSPLVAAQLSVWVADNACQGLHSDSLVVSGVPEGGPIERARVINPKPLAEVKQTKGMLVVVHLRGVHEQQKSLHLGEQDVRDGQASDGRGQGRRDAEEQSVIQNTGGMAPTHPVTHLWAFAQKSRGNAPIPRVATGVKPLLGGRGSGRHASPAHSPTCSSGTVLALWFSFFLNVQFFPGEY